MKHTAGRLITTFFTGVTFCSISQAEDMVVDAAVISSEQFVTSQVIDRDESCYAIPQKNASLQELLIWDIRCDEVRYGDVSNYRVTYEVDGSRFVTTIKTPPGSTLPVRLSFQ